MTKGEFNRFVKKHTAKRRRPYRMLCYECRVVIKEAPATLIGPPDHKTGECERMDLCPKCWSNLVELCFL